MNTACCSLIYKKCFQLEKNVIQKVTTGKLVNLISNDVSKFELAITNLHFVWYGPVEVFVACYFTDVMLGHVASSSILLLFLCFLFQCKLYILNCSFWYNIFFSIHF